MIIDGDTNTMIIYDSHKLKYGKISSPTFKGAVSLHIMTAFYLKSKLFLFNQSKGTQLP